MEPFWRILYKPEGKKPLPIRLAVNDLSNQRLRECKARFGPAYGIPAEFISLLLRGDMDAVACAIWIGQQKAGGEVEDPREMDFTIDDLEPLEDPKAEEDEGEQEKRPTKRQTRDSAKTSTDSETDTSSSSTPSAD